MHRSAWFLPVAAVALALSGVLAAACGSFSSQVAPSGDAMDPMGEGSVRPDGAPIPACDKSALNFDRNHCGACNHDCLGGDCKMGNCQPLVVGRSPGRILHLAVNATHVVWMSAAEDYASAELRACDKTKFCSGEALVIKGGGLAGTVAGDGTSAYATFVFGAHAFMQIDHASTTPIAALFYHPAIERIQVRTDAVYYLGFGEQQDAGGTPIVFSWDGKGNSDQRVVSYPGTNTNIRGFVVTPDWVYFGANNWTYLEACRLTDCTKATLGAVDTQSYSLSLETDDRSVFWTASDGLLRKLPAKTKSRRWNT